MLTTFTVIKVKDEPEGFVAKKLSGRTGVIVGIWKADQEAKKVFSYAVFFHHEELTAEILADDLIDISHTFTGKLIKIVMKTSLWLKNKVKKIGGKS